jgi:hypothetical protein
MKNTGYYHCANYNFPAEKRGEPVLTEELRTLCGKLVIGYIWDYPEQFALEPIVLIKCPECMAHPDYPLLVLGAG